MSKKHILVFHFLVGFIFLLPTWLNYETFPKKYYYQDTEQILRDAGFLDYVNNHVDSTTYLYVESFIAETEDGPTEAFGATLPCLNCEREVSIAVLYKTDVFIASTLVHEAAHHDFCEQFGIDKNLRGSNERYARAMQSLFYLRYTGVQSRKFFTTPPKQ